MHQPFVEVARAEQNWPMSHPASEQITAVGPCQFLQFVTARAVHRLPSWKRPLPLEITLRQAGSNLVASSRPQTLAILICAIQQVCLLIEIGVVSCFSCTRPVFAGKRWCVNECSSGYSQRFSGVQLKRDTTQECIRPRMAWKPLKFRRFCVQFEKVRGVCPARFAGRP